MKKIKVAHIITLLEFGGAQQNTLYTVSNLNRLFFSPILISGKTGYLDEDAKKIKDLKLYFTPFLIRSIRPWMDLVSFLYLLIVLLKEKPLIVHTHSSKAGILGRWAAFFSKITNHKIKIIHTFHGFGFNPYQKSITRSFFILLEKLTAFITDKLIMVSNDNMKKILNYKISNNSKLQLIRSGVKISMFKNTHIDVKWKKQQLGIQPNEKVITMVCPFKIQKDPISFVYIVKELSNKYNNVKALLIGDGELRDEIESCIRKFNLQGKLLLLGWRRDVAEILKITDIFVLTSLWEGLPRALIESMLSGAVPVVSEVDGIKDIIKDGENGFLVKPKDIDGFVKKISILLDDEQLRQKIRNNALNSVTQDFDIDYMVKQQEELYLSLLPS